MATVEERKEALPDAEPDMRALGMVTPRREWLRDELWGKWGRKPSKTVASARGSDLQLHPRDLWGRNLVTDASA